MSAEQQLADYCDEILNLADPFDHTNLSRLAFLSTQPQYITYSAAIVDTIESALLSSTPSGTNQQLALWAFVDKLCKQSSVFVEELRSNNRIVVMATRGAPQPSTGEETTPWAFFKDILGSLKHFFGNATIALIHSKLQHLGEVGGNASATTISATTPQPSRSNTALIEHSRQLKSLGGFTMQRGNQARRPGEEHALQVKTRDSLMAMRVGGAYAPAMPVEMTLPTHHPDVDAPQGYMQALPENHVEQYVDQRRQKLRDLIKKNREAEDNEGGEDDDDGELQRKRKNKKKRLESSTKRLSMEERAIDIHNAVVMPLEFPRDEFGVKIGNFPEGVKFLRDVIRECGGALELEVIVQRISTMADKENQREFGNIREFIDIHKPTFRVGLENNKWIVRLAEVAEEEDDAVTSGKFSWEELECPGCSRLLKGRNLGRHMNSRRCAGIQLANGLKGKAKTPISRLSYAAKWISERILFGEADDLDDDDLLWFAQCIDEAGDVKRFRLASVQQFMPIIRAIRLVRRRWLSLRNCKEMSELPIRYEDRGFIAIFEQLGANIHRLPIAWLETGDIVDMCKRFVRSPVKPAFPPPPKAADPRIRLTNSYPSMLFCESDNDMGNNNDEQISDDDEMFSDDEGDAFVFAPPVSVLETMMVAGRKRDTQKLNFRLRTAPPMQLTKVLKAERDQTMQQVHASLERKAPVRQQTAPIQQPPLNPQGGPSLQIYGAGQQPQQGPVLSMSF